MRTTLAPLSALLLLAGAALAGSAQAKEKPGIRIAYVDMQRALLEVEDGKAAKKALEKMKKERQGKLDAQQEELRALQKNLEAQKAFMKKDVLEAKQQEFREKLGKLQMTFAQLQKELAAEEAKKTKAIFMRMGNILAQMGKAGDYEMIFEKTESSLLWAKPHLDLTNELIRRYDKGEGKVKAGGKGKK